MKKNRFLIFLVIMISAFALNAQVIPNYSFEKWKNGATQAPDGWQDHGSNHTGFNPVTQSTDHYYGNYSVHIENKIQGGDTTKGVIETINPDNSTDYGARPTFKVNTRYKSLKGYYKFIPDKGDSAVIIVFLYKTGYVNPQGLQTVVAIGWKTLGVTTSVWTPFSSMDFYYFDATVVPDSAYIRLSAYQDINFTTQAKMYAKGNSAFYVDGLNFDTYLSGINAPENTSSGLKVYPDPANGKFDLGFETTTREYTSIKIYDLQGKEVNNLYSGILNQGSHVLHYDVSGLDNGSYIIMVATENGYKTEKLIIQK